MLTQQSYAATDGSGHNALEAVTKNDYDPTTGRLSAVEQGTTLTNTVPVTEYFYDNNFNGTGTDEGRVTAVQSLKASTSTSTWATTMYLYDGYARQNETIAPAPGGTSGLDPVETLQTYDSSGRPLDLETLDATTGTLLSESQNVYSGVYLTDSIQCEVASNGTLTGQTLDTHYDYGDYGRLVKTTNPSGSFSKTLYSLDGTVLSQYTCSDEGTPVDPTNTQGDTVVEQTDFAYDNLGDVILTTSYQRHEGSSATGAFTPSTTDARVTYAAAWFDGQGREITSADYGAAGGGFSRPLSPPSTSGSVLVTTYGYDGYGRQNSITDPMGHQTLQVFDVLGRLTYTIDNFKAGSTYWGQTGGQDDYTQPLARPTDVNQITGYDYNLAGQLSDQVVVDPACDGNAAGQQADNQTTSYIYSGDLSSPTNGTPVPRSDLLRATIYPDSTDSVAQVILDLNAGTADDFVGSTYYANGTQATKTDQRGVVHQFSYDDLNRLTFDQVTSLGSANQNVDGTVRAIATAYNQRGLSASVTSLGYDSNNQPTVTLNQIVLTYDNWGDVSQSQQAHNGTVGTGTPSVQYAYDSLDRLQSVTYPTTTRVVGYSYGTSGGMDDRLSRVTAITDGGSNTYAAYRYLGAGTIINTAHPQVTGGLNLSLGTAANGYSGFDQFGRVVDQVWKTDAGSVLDEYEYGFDFAGNRLWKQNAAPNATALDELYTYDGLDRLTSATRGQLDAAHDAILTGTQDFSQTLNLDGLGNFAQSVTNGATQNRTTNTANEITSITGNGAASPTYDMAGNLTNDGTLKYAYDAWNRQTAVSTAGAGSLIATYSYDGLNRRITKTLNGGATTEGTKGDRRIY